MFQYSSLPAPGGGWLRWNPSAAACWRSDRSGGHRNCTPGRWKPMRKTAVDPSTVLGSRRMSTDVGPAPRLSTLTEVDAATVRDEALLARYCLELAEREAEGEATVRV